MPKFAFAVMLTHNNDTGDLKAVYFRLRRGAPHETREFANGFAFADYSHEGYLLGIELLGPCSVTIVDRIAANESPADRRRMKAFVKDSGPRSIVAA